MQSAPYFDELPIDTRHELAKEAKRRGFARKNAPTIKDFPKEWLSAASSASASA